MPASDHPSPSVSPIRRRNSRTNAAASRIHSSSSSRFSPFRGVSIHTRNSRRTNEHIRLFQLSETRSPTASVETVPEGVRRGWSRAFRPVDPVEGSVSPAEGTDAESPSDDVNEGDQREGAPPPEDSLVASGAVTPRSNASRNDLETAAGGVTVHTGLEDLSDTFILLVPTVSTESEPHTELGNFGFTLQQGIFSTKTATSVMEARRFLQQLNRRDDLDEWIYRGGRQLSESGSDNVTVTNLSRSLVRLVESASAGNEGSIDVRILPSTVLDGEFQETLSRTGHNWVDRGEIRDAIYVPLENNEVEEGEVGEDGGEPKEYVKYTM